MQGALLADFAEFWIGRFAREQRGRDHFLVRDDHAKHIGGHHGADHGTDMDEGPTPRKHLPEQIGGPDDQREDADGQKPRPLANRRAAQEIIGDPAAEQRQHRDDDGLARRHLQHGRIDEKSGRIPVILHDKQGKAGQKGEIGLPFEPMEIVRQRFGCNEIFLDMVETAAMHQP